MNKAQQIKALRGKVNAAYGGNVSKAAHRVRRISPRVSTDIVPLDHAMGVEKDGTAGVPTGLITMFVGDKSSGKTTTALRVLANAQRSCARCWRRVKSGVSVIPVLDDKGEPVLDEDGEVTYTLSGHCDCYAKGIWEPKHPKEYPDGFDTKKALHEYEASLEALKENSYEPVVAAYFDIENALALEWAEARGVILEVLELVKTSSGEQGIDTCTEYIRSGLIDFYILDSLAALVPQIEIESSTEEQQRAAQAKLLNKAVRVWTGVTAEVLTAFNKRVTGIWIQQERSDMQKTVKPGGKGQDFAESIEIRFWKSDVEEVEDPAYKGVGGEKGKVMRQSRCRQNFIVNKNKTAPTEKMKASYRLSMMDDGDVKAGDILEHDIVQKLLQVHGLVAKEGQKYVYVPDGFESTSQSGIMRHLDDPDIRNRMRRTLLCRMAGHPDPTFDEDVEEVADAAGE